MWLCGTRLQEQNKAGPFDKQKLLLLPGSYPPHDVLGKIIVSGRCGVFLPCLSDVTPCAAFLSESSSRLLRAVLVVPVSAESQLPIACRA